ncbi:DegT/DnrJ/EryC1/StrS family aminotransferase [Paenibacillus sp. MBLB4367]|uniref:DegT/DnrJ/EryC1/StrS family aminotransferase n=1 Tax=Paenibacillus sp. MBLB4367 TaxID=3384767 RepID=UPI003907F75C
MEKLAVYGGTPVRQQPFPAWPVYGELEEKLLIEALRSGKWGGSGAVQTEGYQAKLPLFETAFRQLHDASYAVPVVNGTIAITAALHAAGVGPGDEVIMPPYTFIATATSALLYGVIPVFADVEEDTLLLDPVKAEQAITPRTKAIVAVHIGGAPADLTRLKAIADKHGLRLIEDSAQAVGAQWEGRGVGAIGDFGTFSFQSSKNVNAGEGGVILTNDRELWEQAWSFCNVGRIPEGGWYQHERFGLNLRMTEFQAAVLLAQMSRLEEQMALRERNAEMLNGLLGEIGGIRLLKRDPRVTRHAWHLYMFKLDEALTAKTGKEEILGRLQAEGIPATSGYIPLNRNKAVLEKVRQWTGEERIDDCPVCERLCEKEVVWLHQNVLLADEQAMHDIARALKKVTASLV